MSSYKPDQTVHVDNEFYTFLNPDQQRLRNYIDFEGSFEPYRKYINFATYPLHQRIADPIEREVTFYRFQMEFALDQLWRTDYDHKWSVDMMFEAGKEIDARTKVFARELWLQSLVFRDGDYVIFWQGDVPGYQEKRWEDIAEGRVDNVEMKAIVQQMFERMSMDEQMERLNL